MKTSCVRRCSSQLSWGMDQIATGCVEIFAGGFRWAASTGTRALDLESMAKSLYGRGSIACGGSLPLTTGVDSPTLDASSRHDHPHVKTA